MGDSKVGCMVIGSGPGGYVAGIRLGQLGVDAVVVERDKPGGVCLNVGCIPSKALIHVAEQIEWLREHAAEQGVRVSGFTLDGAAMQKWKSAITSKLTGGVTHLLRGNKVDYLTGTATFVGPHEVEVMTAEGPARIQPDNVIVSTGCHGIQVPGFEFTHERVIGFREALDLTQAPEDLVVVGGGVIGLELGTVWARLGSNVTIVEMTDALLPGTDPDLVRPVARALKKRGVAIHLGAKAEGFDEPDGPDGKALVRVTTAKGSLEIPADKVLVAVGFRPNSEGLGLDAAGVTTDPRGYISVDGQCRTNVGHIYAVGDVTGPPFLAHRASRMGEVAAEVIGGQNVSMDDVRAMPAAVFTAPEISTVGLQEHDAKAHGLDVSVGRFPFLANGRALTLGDAQGLVKVVVDKASRRIVGVGIVGPGASELIAQCALALEMDASAQDLGLTVHTHPTLSEAVQEAAKSALGEAIHALN